MAFVFSPGTEQFYDIEVDYLIPEDARPVTDEQRALVMARLAAGGALQISDGGAPSVADPFAQAHGS